MGTTGDCPIILRYQLGVNIIYATSGGIWVGSARVRVTEVV